MVFTNRPNFFFFVEGTELLVAFNHWKNVMSLMIKKPSIRKKPLLWWLLCSGLWKLSLIAIDLLLRKLLLYLFQLLHLDNRNGYNLQINFYSVDFKSACFFREVTLWGMFLYVENFYMVFGYRVVVIFGWQVRKIINDGFLKYFHYYLGNFSKDVFVCWKSLYCVWL